jgi:hypothetical protein
MHSGHPSFFSIYDPAPIISAGNGYNPIRNSEPNYQLDSISSLFVIIIDNIQPHTHKVSPVNMFSLELLCSLRFFSMRLFHDTHAREQSVTGKSVQS